MDYELELNKANRLKLARVFRNHKRVDLSIDCVLEGQMGRAFVDNPRNPRAYRITTGPFWYLAGEASSPGGGEMMKGLPAYHLVMPSPPDWLELARQIYDMSLEPFTRYSFSAETLSQEHLANCLAEFKDRTRIIPIDGEIAARLAALPESCFEIAEFDSVQDFVERGIGYTILENDTVMGVAYSSLVCTGGIEVSIYVEEPYRQRGIATALGSQLLLECLRLGLRPNWDAANRESFRLAKKLGYTFIETYDAYYHTPE